jgi:GntR family transcriptional regulator
VIFVVDPFSPVTAYVQVADAIEARIRSGQLKHLNPIPSETQLQNEFVVSRGTARRAVSVLRERGLVFTIPGRATYVGPRPAADG